MLKDKILNAQSGILTYGLTPPKAYNLPEKMQEIAENQLKRIQNLPIDALILYDIQDEKDRIEVDRPFPFLPTLDPSFYHQQYLSSLSIPCIIYCCVGKFKPEQLIIEFEKTKNQENFWVFVGAASRNQILSLKLPEAYDLFQKYAQNTFLGGVTIPERHLLKENEHLKIIQKTQQACSFFVSQAVYNVEAAKNLLSDYYYYSIQNKLKFSPIIFTLTPCGSAKTLQFMKWLGISIPKWLENDLLHAQNILSKSLENCLHIFQELWGFAQEKGIPVGFNIESLSIKKDEIEASIELVQEIKKRIIY